MKKIYTYITIIAIKMLSGCQIDDLHNAELDGAWLTIRLNSQSNQIATRATSGDDEEKFISNAYVFIFNSTGGKVFSKLYENLNKLQEITINAEDVTGGNDMTIAVIANIGDRNGIMNISSDNLDGISSKQELMETQVAMVSKFLERGNSFLMSGFQDNVSLSSPTNKVTIPLKRVDSKIRFNIRTGNANGNLVTFTPTEWRVVSAPKRVLLMEDITNKDAVPTNLTNYFASDWQSYEDLSSLPGDTPDGVVATFAFYALENNITAKENIPTDRGLTTEQRYALRDEQLKNEDHTNKAEFRYANDVGTYIELKGNVHYRLDVDKEVSADVKYMIHLGGDKEDVDNYSNIRNTSYTYNVTIQSVNKIIVEVEDGIEERPGAEGDVVIAERIIDDIDAYNSVLSVVFHRMAIDENLTWDVLTPFSKGNASDNPKDFDWIFFRIAKKANTNHYIEKFRTYLGDDGIYTDDVTSANAGAFVNKYIEDIESGRDKMLNIKQLVEVLKECKSRYSSESHLFDPSGNIVFTAFVKEFYYDTNPERASEHVEDGLWKRFTNVDKRVMNILTVPRKSPDGMSSKTVALYSLRQASIQTMYNRSSNENFSGWGSQFFPNTPLDETSFVSNENRDPTPINTESDGAKNGRKNFATYFRDGARWDNYIDLSIWKLKDSYNYAKYKCLSQNRDMNGNDRIDENELQWYLASINQLTDLWIGEESMNPTSKLYQHNTWELTRQHVVSSTVLTRNDPEVLWASEGSSVGRLSGANKKVLHYRCVRNLGLSKDASVDIKPDDIYVYKTPYLKNGVKHDGEIDLRRLDNESIRGFLTTQELPDHDLRDPRGYNKPYSKFEIYYDALITTTNLSFGRTKGQTWEEVKARSQPGGSNPLCPKGWRVPNQRELALMFSIMTNIDDNGKTFTAWPLQFNTGPYSRAGADHFSRTGFNKSWTTDRPGFSVSRSNNILYMLNGKDDGNGGVRCVRDID